MRRAGAQTGEALAALAAAFGDRLSIAPAVLAAHAHDESWHPPAPPDGVVFPQTREEVALAARICHAHRVPMVPFGIGSSMEGNVQAVEGGVCIDTSRLTRILSFNVEDMDCTVEAGVDREALDRHLRQTGLFFPVDPGAPATLGGMAATRASGTTTARYGSMRENVMALEVVLADGEIIRTGSRARKSASGYDLTRLLVGSEGTLGVITAVTLRLHPVPSAVVTATAAMPSLRAAVGLVQALMQAGLPFARLELLDEIEMSALNRYDRMDMAEVPTLFIELHGSAATVDEAVGELSGLAEEFRASGLQWARTEEARTRLWRARHNAAYAERTLRPGADIMVTDVCVPLSQLADCIHFAKEELNSAGLLGGLVGHVGDGNFHMSLLIDRNSSEEVADAKAFHARLVKRAIDLEGTATGEHGIGLGKARFLELEHGAAAVAVMRAVKAALDPLNLMNPGKLFT